MAPKLDYIAKIKLLDDPQNLVISSNHYIYPYYEYPLGGLSFKDPKSNKTTYISMAFKDDAIKLSPIDQNYLMALSNDTTYIIDLEDKSLSLGIDGRYEKAYRLFEELLLIDEESHMRFLSLKRPFTLKEVPEVISHKDLTLDFEKGDGEISISANDVLLEKSASDQITIELAQGYHQLDLSYEDKDGRLAFGSVEISVIKPTTINIISYVIIILFSLLFITFITFNLLKSRRSS